ncbi:zinc finger domain-containing protein [Apiospora saccharicola]|uniref:Zinc finger domain-containing protein n=1 Tax=Apiospora saccharicola TaxID=335842 RepID=A0ABR1W2U5_9PEZI
MADPLLTSLCGICHMREPKYKCPRCHANTCSLPCVKKHKKWSSCNGERDPTVYMPPSQLRTDAGIDHDYNFLTKIERSLEQTEKLLIHERGILPDLSQQQNDHRSHHGPPHKKARLNKGQSRGRTTLDGGSRSWARAALGRLRALDITVKHQPYGMNRPKNNTTSFNKRTQTINWQVEWCFFDPSTSTENSTLQPEKLLNKTLDSVPIYLGYADCREFLRRSQMSKKEKEQERKQKQSDDAAEVEDDDTNDSNAIPGGQDWENSTWAAVAAPVQGKDGCWHRMMVGGPKKTSDRQMRAETTKDEYQFYYHVPGTPSREDQKLIPIHPDETLASVLSGLEVLEFPSIYVTPAGMRLPPGYRRANRPTKNNNNNNNSSSNSRGGVWVPQKRKGEVLVEYGSSEEEGEIADDNDAEEELGSDIGLVPEDDTTSSSGSDSDEEME